MSARKLQMGIYVLMMFMGMLYVCNAFTPTDNYLIDCGSPSNTVVGRRTFMADTSISWTLTTKTDSMANTSSSSVSSFSTPSLYQTARIFTDPSSYSFPIKQQGRHFIRLYFFPFSSPNFKLTTANFTVSTQDSVLLQSYPAGSASTPLFREYLLNITRSTLILSFVPLSNNSLAFINAIEVVSVPDNLIGDTARIVNPIGNYEGLSDEPLQTVYRINMGGPLVNPDNDTLWRTWQPDQSFLLDKNLAQFVSFSGKINYLDGNSTEEIAPDVVYSTATELASSMNGTSDARFNVTWQFDVDPGSSYFVRMHFCDIVSKALFELYFDVYISSYMAVSDLDLSTTTVNVLAAACYMDFVVDMADGSRKLNISIGPSSLENVLPDGILNGLEIMKINSTGTATVVSPPGSKANVGVIVGAVLGALAGVAIAVCIICTMLRRRRRMGRKQNTKAWLPFSINGTVSQSMGSRFSNGTTATLGNVIGYQFSFAVLQEATNNFDEGWVIGVGGFGKVYKGVLRDETKVAVKRGNPKSQQGLNEFRTEIELLSRLRHRHLVSLIGYCDERNEMILVYEYMEEGTLKNHLYGSDLPNLSWKQRLEICIGSARGLHYLHTGQAKAIIHRDVKSANILLDENLMAKVADFGLSKTGPELDQTHVSTAVKGSFGYLDPEYFRRQQLTEKSDVYSFGVVLLEVLCARPVIDPTLPREMVNLAEWAIKFQRRGELDRIVDPRITGTIKPDSLRKFGETVEKCLADCGVDRPAMGDVLWNLEYVLQLQEVESGYTDVNSINWIDELPSQVQNISNSENVAVDEHDPRLNDLSDVSMSRVFSQLVKSEGR